MLGVAPAFANGASWATSALLLRRLERYRAPADKVTMMVNACRLIERRMHSLAQEANAAAALRSDPCSSEPGDAPNEPTPRRRACGESRRAQGVFVRLMQR